jgi:hypothetical protein
MQFDISITIDKKEFDSSWSLDKNKKEENSVQC